MLDIGGRQPVHHIGNAAGNMRLTQAKSSSKRGLAQKRPCSAASASRIPRISSSVTGWVTFRKRTFRFVRSSSTSAKDSESARSEERRVGKEGVSTGRSRGAPYH